MLVLADIDGVLIDSFPMIFNCYAQAFTKANAGHLSEDTFRNEIWGKSWEEVVQFLHRYENGMNLVESTIHDIRAYKEILFKEAAAAPMPVEDIALGFYQLLDKNHDFAFCTAASKTATELKLKIMEGFGVENLRSRRVYYLREKHLSHSWKGLLYSIGVSPGDVLVIDDNPKAVQAAKAAGCRAILWST